MAGSRSRFVILIRGINVGGKKKLPMALLRDVCESIGCEDVTTYVQSGNAIATFRPSAATLAPALESALESAVGFAPRVVIRQHTDLIRILDRNPYPDTDERFLHIGFMTKPPTRTAMAELGDIDCSPEGYTIVGREIYLNYINGAGRSQKLGRIPFERKLGVGITARSLRTVKKLADLSADPA